MIRLINPKWRLTRHARERASERLGLADDALLVEMLERARITREKPASIFGDGEADLWADVDGAIFPILRNRDEMIVTTCLIPWMRRDGGGLSLPPLYPTPQRSVAA